MIIRTISSFNLQHSIRIEADMESHEIFDELEQSNIECGYIARDNKVAKKYVLRDR